MASMFGGGGGAVSAGRKADEAADRASREADARNKQVTSAENARKRVRDGRLRGRPLLSYGHGTEGTRETLG